jgi:CoA-transferase family III
VKGSAADLASWAAGGAMALTGPVDGPPSLAPASVAVSLIAAAEDLAAQTARWGQRVVVDGPALLGERAAITSMVRRGDVSVGGSARFVAAADGWVVVNLPRPEDVASLPALVGEVVPAHDWRRISSALGRMSVAAIVEQATLLGMAVAGLGDGPAPAFPARELFRGGARTPAAAPLVVDLSSLWAGPLAASLLGAAGARVVKVEGRGRPDGARRGSTAFFDLLNHGKECVQVDLADRDDRRFLHRLLRAADLVLEASRPRVMDAVGVSPEALAERGTSWLSITAHGRTGPAAHRIGFGDDAAVAGGLYLRDDHGGSPMFVADAAADPIAGLAAAAVGAELLAGDRAALMEVPLSHAAAWAASTPVAKVSATVATADGDGWEVLIEGERVPVAAPRHRRIPGSAFAVGSHDGRLRTEFASL